MMIVMLKDHVMKHIRSHVEYSLTPTIILMIFHKHTPAAYFGGGYWKERGKQQFTRVTSIPRALVDDDKDVTVTWWCTGAIFTFTAYQAQDHNQHTADISMYWHMSVLTCQCTDISMYLHYELAHTDIETGMVLDCHKKKQNTVVVNTQITPEK